MFLGYGTNQKGYRCYDLVSEKIITTMNCNFLECEYFFHTHTQGQGRSCTCTSQGENPSDSIRPLSWDVLPQTGNSIVEPTEQASATAEQITSAVGPPQPPTPQSCPPPVLPETGSNSTIITPNNYGVEEDAEIDGDTGDTYSL